MMKWYENYMNEMKRLDELSGYYTLKVNGYYVKSVNLDNNNAEFTYLPTYAEAFHLNDNIDFADSELAKAYLMLSNKFIDVSIFFSSLFVSPVEMEVDIVEGKGLVLIEKNKPETVEVVEEKQEERDNSDSSIVNKTSDFDLLDVERTVRVLSNEIAYSIIKIEEYKADNPNNLQKLEDLSDKLLSLKKVTKNIVESYDEDRVINSRFTLVKDSFGWVNAGTLVKKGDIYKLYEAWGEIVRDKYGNTIFKAESDAYEENGIIVIDSKSIG